MGFRWPNETKLSRGERERAWLSVEGFYSCENWIVRRLAVGCSDWLGLGCDIANRYTDRANSRNEPAQHDGYAAPIKCDPLVRASNELCMRFRAERRRRRGAKKRMIARPKRDHREHPQAEDEDSR